MVPSPFSYILWSDAHQEFTGWERQRTPEEDAQCRGKLPFVQAGKGVNYEPMFDTERSSFFPCILHIMMICGKLILSLTRKVALDLPNDRVRLPKATFKAANIRWRGLHKEYAPDGQEVKRLLCAWDAVAHVLRIHRSAADEAVRQLGEVLRELYHSGAPVDGFEHRVELAARNFQLHCVPHYKSSYLYILIHDMKTIISECRNLRVGVAMFSNNLKETVNAIMKGKHLQQSSRGAGSAREYGFGKASALRQTILHVFLLNHAHLGAHGVPRPCTSRLASLDRSIQKPNWTKTSEDFWSSRSGKRYAVKIMMILTIITITIIFSKKNLKFFSSGKLISNFHLKKKILIVRRKIRRTKKIIGKNRSNCKTRKKVYFLPRKPFLPPQAHKQAPAATVTPSKELPAADQLVHTPTQLAQHPVRQLELSATDSPRSALGSPPSRMSGYKLSSHEKVVLEECRLNQMFLKCLEDDVDIPGPSTPIYTDPTVVHMTLNHAFGGCWNKLTKQHQSMSLDAWVTANQLADQRPFGVPLTGKQRENPPCEPLVHPTALLKLSGVIWKLHGVVELHAEAGECMLWFSSTPAPDGWNIAIPEGKQKGRPPVTSAPPPAMRSTSAPLQEASEPLSAVAAAPNWSPTLMAAVTARLGEKATKQRQYEVGNL